MMQEQEPKTSGRFNRRNFIGRIAMGGSLVAAAAVGIRNAGQETRQEAREEFKRLFRDALAAAKDGEWPNDKEHEYREAFAEAKRLFQEWVEYVHNKRGGDEEYKGSEIIHQAALALLRADEVKGYHDLDLTDKAAMEANRRIKVAEEAKREGLANRICSDDAMRDLISHYWKDVIRSEDGGAAPYDRDLQREPEILVRYFEADGLRYEDGVSRERLEVIPKLFLIADRAVPQDVTEECEEIYESYADIEKKHLDSLGERDRSNVEEAMTRAKQESMYLKNRHNLLAELAAQ